MSAKTSFMAIVAKKTVGQRTLGAGGIAIIVATVGIGGIRVQHTALRNFFQNVCEGLALPPSPQKHPKAQARYH